jgi:hypothetical protein
MAVISFKTLNNNVQDAISMGKFPEKNLRELSAGLKASQKKEMKFLFIIVGVMAVFIGGLFGYILYSNPVEVQEHLLGWILGYLGIVAIIFLGSYFTQIGIIKGQFNIALREGYPELYKELKL